MPPTFATVDEHIAHLEAWQSTLADKRREALVELRRLYRQRGEEHDDARADSCTYRISNMDVGS